ncbi:MAG: hypothetical protein HY918_03280 [Candidatus Doudnabacteria bacterium]|nr:hypothetical protein [Candidatus Doudnabacteria bacterium]
MPKNLSVRLSDDEHRELKVLCAKLGVFIQAFAYQAISSAVNPGPAQEQQPRSLTTAEKKELVSSVKKIFENGDPDHIALLTATITFWHNKLKS